MSGELTLDHENWWRDTLPLAVVTVLAAAVAVWPLIRLMLRRGVEGVALQAASGVLTLALWWAVHALLSRLLPKAEKTRTLVWTLTPDTLDLGGDRIPRDSIRMVHCWKSREGVWTVNLETTGKNRLLRTLSEGEAADRSRRQLRAMVIALGYGGQWAES